MDMLIYILPAAFVAALALLVGFAFAGKNLRSTLLGFDADGWQPLGLGGTLFVVGIITPDFAAQNILVGLGMLFGLYGVLILAKDSTSEALTGTLLGLVYVVLAAGVYYLGATWSGAFGFDLRSLMTLVLPSFGASLALTLAVITMTSQAHKDRLSQDVGGGSFIIIGILLLAGSAFARLNPALMITTASAGGLLTALGALVVMDDATSDAWMLKSKMILYIPAALGLLLLSRSLY